MSSLVLETKVVFSKGEQCIVASQNLVKNVGNKYFYFWSPNDKEVLKDQFFNIKNIPKFLNDNPFMSKQRGLYLCNLVSESIPNHSKTLKRSGAAKTGNILKKVKIIEKAKGFSHNQEKILSEVMPNKNSTRLENVVERPVSVGQENIANANSDLPKQECDGCNKYRNLLKKQLQLIEIYREKMKQFERDLKAVQNVKEENRDLTTIIKKKVISILKVNDSTDRDKSSYKDVEDYHKINGDKIIIDESSNDYISILDLKKVENSTGHSESDDRKYINKLMNILWTKDDLCRRCYNVYKKNIDKNVIEASPLKINFARDEYQRRLSNIALLTGAEIKERNSKFNKYVQDHITNVKRSQLNQSKCLEIT